MFVFDAALVGATNVDYIGDFTSGTDRLQLDWSVFTSLTPGGPLSNDPFVLGSAAADANDFIIFDQSMGALLYDADGNGADSSAVQLATLGVRTTLTAGDILAG